MDFEELRECLLALIRERVRGGALTERRLAGDSGISQPHIHNVLKGARTLSPAFADRLVHCLRVDLSQFCGVPQDSLSGLTTPVQGIPVMAGRLGVGLPYPAAYRRAWQYPFSVAGLVALENPAISRVAGDAGMVPLFREGDLVLLDRSERKRVRPDSPGIFVVSASGDAVLRYIRRGPSCLYTATVISLADPRGWDCISLAGRNILDVVRAKIVWIGRQMESTKFAEGPPQETR